MPDNLIDNQLSPDRPLVSIGIMSYNRPAGLRQTLECITSQTYKNLQIIITDNGSIDSEVKNTILEYAAKDQRISFFMQPKNLGPGFSFAFVLKKAIGEYFMWAADDDYWDSAFIEEMVLLLQANKQAMVAFCAVNLKGSSQTFDYLDEHADLSSPDINKRFKNYLSWKEGRLCQGNFVYGLHRRRNAVACEEKIVNYTDELRDDMKIFSPDIFFNYNVLARGPAVFSHKRLYSFALGGSTVFVYGKKDNITDLVWLKINKNFDVFIRREKYYFYVLKTIWQSDASVSCFVYAVFMMVKRHFGALRFVSRKLFFRKKYE